MLLMQQLMLSKRYMAIKLACFTDVLLDLLKKGPQMFHENDKLITNNAA